MRQETAAPTSRAVSPILGQSPTAVRLRDDIARAARFSSTVLVTGPSGAGKELVARWIHELSPRAGKSFVPVDCTSLTGDLMASQLFGHVTGAFTGANCEALGCFRAAEGGTIFLDEIGELEFSLQAKLLRVLQERSVTPVGSYAARPVDVRVVAATNRDLREEVAAGRFREDLYYRLRVVHLRTTPLSEKREDILLLANSYLTQMGAEGLPHCMLTPAAAKVLADYDWPGNVRQLRNLLEQAVIGADGPWLESDIVACLIEDEGWRPIGASKPAEVGNTGEPFGAEPEIEEAASETESQWASLANIECAHVLRTLEHTFYNRAAAARLLGITRQSLLRKMTRYGIRAPRD